MSEVFSLEQRSEDGSAVMLTQEKLDLGAGDELPCAGCEAGVLGNHSHWDPAPSACTHRAE